LPILDFFGKKTIRHLPDAHRNSSLYLDGDEKSYPHPKRSMTKNQLFSLVKHLYNNRATREQKKLFFAEGIRNFFRATEHGYAIRAIVYNKALCKHSAVRQKVAQLEAAGTALFALTPEEFRAISFAEHASGIGLLLEYKTHGLETCKHGTWLVLETVRQTGNLGTLLRSNAATGGAGLIVLGRQIDPFSPDTVRASMGSIFAQKIVRSSLVQFGRFVQAHGFAPIGASPDGTCEYHRLEYPEPTFLLLGEERKGLTQAQREVCQTLVRIPMQANTDSLNLGIAGSLLLYEKYLTSRDDVTRFTRAVASF
jgi:RNA methyltransferase, TrmH family